MAVRDQAKVSGGGRGLAAAEAVERGKAAEARAVVLRAGDTGELLGVQKKGSIEWSLP